MSILIRVHHPSGRTRLTVAETASFQDFQTELHKVTGIPPFGQTLTLDEAGSQRLFGRPHASVETVGLVNGCVVWVKGEPEESQATVASALTPAAPHAPLAPPAAPPAAVAAAPAAPPAAATAVAGSGGAAETAANGGAASSGPKHQTFEGYLRIRRFDVGTLSGNLKYQGVRRQKLTKMPPAVSLTRQAYRHVDHVEFMNVEEVGNFVRHWQGERHCITQRCGWLYGYYVEDTKTYDEGWRAVVEGIYEPPQTDGEEEARTLAAGEAEVEQVDKLMEVLGLERLGYIWTSRPRSSLVSSKEIVEQASRQLKRSTDEHYTGYRLSKQVGVVVKVDEASGHAEPEAVMASDQAMAMVRDDLVRVDQKAGAQYVQIRQTKDEDELLPAVLQEYKEVKEFDADWLVVKVNHSAPVKPRSFFKFNHFPRENRLNTAGASGYFGKIPRGTPTWQQFSDFHLLMFIAKVVDFETAAAIATAVRDKTEVAEGFVELVKAAVNQF